MNRKLLTLFALFLVLSLLTAQQIDPNAVAVDESALSVGQWSQGRTTKMERFRAVKLVDVGEVKENYLFFIVSHFKDDNNEPINMAIFKNDETKPMAICHSSNLDFCFIESQNVRKGDRLISAIQCTQDCNFKFETYWSTVEQLDANDINRFMFEGTKAKIYHLNLENIQFEEVRILLLPQTKRVAGDEVKVYAKIGYDRKQEPKGMSTVAFYDFESQNLWRDGQGIFLTKGDFQKQKKLTIFVVGETETIYLLQTKIVKTENVEILPKKIQYEYLQKGTQKVYHLMLNDEADIDQYTVHFAKFSGDMQLQFFTDKELTQTYSLKSFDYMNDIKFLILKQQVKKDGVKELYFKVKTSQVNVVFMVLFDTRKLDQSVQLVESIYDFLPVHTKKIAFLHFEDFGAQSINGDMEEVDINLIRVVGEADAEFRICKGQFLSCFSIDTYQKDSKKIEAVDKTILGMKYSFKLKIDPQDFRVVNDFERSAMIMVIITNKAADASLVAIDYLIGDDLQDIREGHPLESMIDASEIKHYKFVNSDPKVKVVKIHVSAIRGQINVRGSREDPRKNPNNWINSVGNQLNFVDQIDQPMYVIIQGLTAAAYGITVQLSHEEVKYSQMSISQNIEYTIRIAPSGAEIIKLHPIFSELHFKYRASSSVLICNIGEDYKCTKEVPKVNKVGSIDINENLVRTNSILISNPSDKNFVEVKLSYKSSDYDNCQERAMESFYTQNVKHDSCFQFPIGKSKGDIVFLMERNDIGPFKVEVFACFQLIDIPLTLPRLVIPAGQIEKRCGNKTTGQKGLALILKGDESKPNEDMKVQFSGVFENSMVNLADGIAFKVSGMSGEGKLNTYFYHAINIVKTTIILRSIRGNFKFFTKIVDKKEKFTTQISPNDYEQYSEASNFFRNPALVLTTEDFLKDSCDQCAVMIAVYSENDIGGLIEYSIEVIQNNFILKDNQNYENHMYEGSIAYYEYEAVKETCNLIIEVSDHNKNCASIYLSKTETPSEDNSIAKEFGTKLTYPNCTKGVYYIGVEAVKDCAYSISISNSPYSITKITRGIPSNIKLKEGEVKYVIFRHITHSGFKLATLNRFGVVDIYANVLDPQHLELFKKGQHLDYEKFQFTNSYTDVLGIEPTDEHFCTDCYYIAAIVAKRETQSSLLLADAQIPIEMSSGKVFNDELLESNEKTVLTFKKILAGSLPFQIHNGEIKAVILYKKERAEHNFAKKKQLQVYNFKLTADANGGYDWSPIRVEISCITPKCAYSVGLLDTTSEMTTANDIVVIPGRPSYMFLEPNANQCVSGFIKEIDDDIVVTVDRMNTDYLGSLKITLQINGKNTEQFTKSTILNVMKIAINQNALGLTSTASYRMCIILPKELGISAIIEQGEDINLLPEDSEVVVENEDTFLVYPEGPFLVDIFECSGETTFKHGFDEDKLDDDLSDLDTIGMPEQSHAIKITSFLPTFLRVKSPLSIIRWLPINEIQERGLGYFKYGIGQLKYETAKDQINVLWNSITKNKETNTTVLDISYKLYISDKMENLKSAASCEKFLVEDVIVINMNIPNGQIIDSNLSYIIPKTLIGKKFKGRKDNIYMNLVADMTLKVPDSKKGDQNKVAGESDQQYYRFLYHAQQIPKDVFAGHEGSIVDEPLVLAAIGVGVFLGVVVIFYVLLKKIIPMVSRMKNRMMLEDPADNQSNKQQDIQVDPVIQSNERIVVDDA